MSIIIRRIFEMMGTCALLSAGIKFLSNMGYLNSPKVFSVCLIGCLVLFVAFNIYAMYSCAMFLMSKWHYYLFNYVAFALFAVCNYVCFFVLDRNLHIWLFGITRYFYQRGIQAFFAMAVFNLVLFVIMTLVPLFARSTKMYTEEDNWIIDVFD